MVHGMTESTPAGPGATTARERLLAAAIAHAERHRIADTSLRELAAAIGTSHRMLIYHFGSKEGLLVAIVAAVEEAQRAFWRQLAADPAISPADLVRTMWRRFADPGLWPQERLFFELYGQALQGRPGTAGLLDDVVGSWITLAAEQAARHGVPAGDARADATLAVATMRGLLLDLLATGDRERTDAAVERYIQLYEASPAPSAPSALAEGTGR
jgi:AcrR family transcriptional regulator